MLPLFYIFKNEINIDQNSIDTNIRMISKQFEFPPNKYAKDKFNIGNEAKNNEEDNPLIESDSKQDEEKIFLELKKELLAKYLVKEKEIASKAQKLKRLESKAKNETASNKKKPKKI